MQSVQNFSANTAFFQINNASNHAAAGHQITGLDLIGAKITGLDLIGAKITGLDLIGAKITGLDLIGA